MTVYDLLVPIAATGFANHIMSMVAWMALPHHKQEWQQLPIEEEFFELIEHKNVPPGQYLFPHAASPEVMNSEEYQNKIKRVRGTLLLWERPPHMLASIGMTLTFFLVTAFVIGYLASLALEPGAEFMKVFQFVTTAGLLAHCAGVFPGVFWFKRKVAMDLIDKVAYAIATGVIFAALWPAA